MEEIDINDLKDKKQSFIAEIRWDVTPKMFMSPGQHSGPKADDMPDDISGYMLYVDLIDEKPALFIMKNGFSQSKTVGFIKNIPEELLRDSMNCEEGDCVADMYPLSEKLEAWLKKEFGLS